MQIAFLHPDLGVGGAERLVVDAAVGLQQRGHHVTMFTQHRDRQHCFEEARDGTLDVRVHGDWLPRSLFGRLHILFAVLRMIYGALVLALTGPRLDVVFVDQVSIAVWPLRLFTRAQIVFYCHFPDMLLSTRTSLLKRLYRAPFDLLEEYSTRAAHVVFVNSEFTADTVMATFRSMRQRPRVLNPTLAVGAMEALFRRAVPTPSDVRTNHVFFSLNRFERKKNIGLALQAFASVLRQLEQQPEERRRRSVSLGPSGAAGASAASLRLVIAGGYDPQNRENFEYARELELEAERLGIAERVTFCRTISGEDKCRWLDASLAVLYTPANEHFGIVPLEAMHAQRPVIAVNSGGPTESIVDGVTGLLVPGEPEAFAAAMLRLVREPELRARMGAAGQARVARLYSLESFTDTLESCMRPRAARD